MKIVTTVALSLSVLLAGVRPTMADERSPSAVKASVPMAMLAPADRYFGPLKMSLLGISNAFVLATRRQTGGDITADTMGSLAQVELSIREWEQQFPKDPWISRAVFALHKTYTGYHDRAARVRAVDSAVWLISKYPASKEAVELRAKLAESMSGGSSPAAGTVSMPTANVATATTATR